MPRLGTVQAMKKMLMPGVFAAGLAVMVGFHAAEVSAQGNSRLWSIAVHIEYQNGMVYEQVFAAGVPTSLMPSILEECGRSHSNGSVVRYHCFPIPE
jgi:hypothetical protein